MSKIVATLALLISITCPILELFDHWDHTEKTGNDTEYTFVLLSLCVGTVFVIAKTALAVRVFDALSGVIRDAVAIANFCLGGGESFYVVPIPLSPPSSALRI